MAGHSVFQTLLNLCFSLLKNNSFSPIRIRKIPKAFESRLCSILFASHADIITAAVPHKTAGTAFFPFHKLVFRVKHKAYYCDRDKKHKVYPLCRYLRKACKDRQINYKHHSSPKTHGGKDTGEKSHRTYCIPSRNITLFHKYPHASNYHKCAENAF